MGLIHKRYLSGARVYACTECQTHFTTHETLTSKNFNGIHGKAYLFKQALNVSEGEEVDRMMRTGKHTVRDISCMSCGTYVGWRYVRAWVEAQRYKEGQYILEREAVSVMSV
ncbi:MAG: Yippee/Mis18 [Piptocephalis tieghemiana]|nr:MAG: Yippee/Mis18 [Piptocephalis tieghemiana]